MLRRRARDDPGTPHDHVPVDAPVGPVYAFESPQRSARGLLASGAMLTAGALIINVLNVVFHVVTARLMTKDEYSLLNSMFAVFLVAMVPLLAVQSTVVREMAQLMARGDDAGAGLVLRSALRTTMRAGLVAVTVALVAFYPLVGLLHIGRPLPVIAIILAFIAQLPAPILAAGLQAAGQFWILTWTGVLQGFTKVAAGTLLAALGFGAAAVTIGFAFAGALSMVFAALALRPFFRLTAGHAVMTRTRVIGRYTLGAAIAIGMQTILTQVGLLWARGTQTSDVAALYAAATVATSVILLIPIGLNTVLFTRVAQVTGSRDGERRHLLIGLVVVAILCVPCVAMLAAFPETLLRIGFGSAYEGAAPWLWALGVATSLYALGLVYLNHFLALGRSSIAWAMGLVLLVQQTMFVLMHDTVEGLITAQIWTAAGMVAVCELFLWMTNRREAARLEAVDTDPLAAVLQPMVYVPEGTPASGPVAAGPLSVPGAAAVVGDGTVGGPAAGPDHHDGA